MDSPLVGIHIDRNFIHGLCYILHEQHSSHFGR